MRSEIKLVDSDKKSKR